LDFLSVLSVSVNHEWTFELGLSDQIPAQQMGLDRLTSLFREAHVQHHRSSWIILFVGRGDLI
jgi:hypothetical protein